MKFREQRSFVNKIDKKRIKIQSEAVLVTHLETLSNFTVMENIYHEDKILSNII